MVAVHKLTRNGNGTQISIPSAFIRTLGWDCGERVAIELCEDGTIWLRRPTVRDLRSPAGRPMSTAPVTVAEK